MKTKVNFQTQFYFVRSFSINIEAVADQAVITVPSATVIGQEDTPIPIPNLTASLFDTNAMNGGEVLSVVITGVPEDTRFNAGSQNGKGSWVFPVSALDTLTITPPEHYSGTMNLQLEAFTFESSNGDEVSVSAPFTVQVEPRADEFLIVARDVALVNSPSGLEYVDLELRLVDQRGTDEAGERAPEYVSFVFENVPAGVRMIPIEGGRLESNGNTFSFTGTAEQASALYMVTGPGTQRKFDNIVDVSGFSVDGESRLANGDRFRVSVDQADRESQSLVADDDTATTLEGGEGNDVLTGLGGE